MIEFGLRTLLLQQESLSVLAGQRIFVGFAPQGTPAPYLVLNVTAEDPLGALDGTPGLAFTDFDLDCYATDVPAAAALAKAVKEFIQDYTGPAGADDTIKAVLYRNRYCGHAPHGDGRDGGYDFITLDVQIQHD